MKSLLVLPLVLTMFFAGSGADLRASLGHTAKDYDPKISGLVAAVADLNSVDRTLIIPPGTSPEYLVSVVATWLDRNPGLGDDEPAVSVIYRALREKYGNIRKK